MFKRAKTCSTGIVTKGDVSVLYGTDAVLSCSIPDATGVKQVTWRRYRDQSVESLATFSERFKNEVAHSYAGKIDASLPSLNSTTMVIKKVTFEDEACYMCSFDVYPSGTKRWKQCLDVEGLSETTVSKASHGPEETDVIVSCSATGKPAPVISWWLEGKQLSQNSSTVLNPDGTSTTTSNQTLSLSQFHGKHVECVAESGSMKNKESIYLPGSTETTVTDRSRYYICSALVVVVFVVACIGLALQRRKKNDTSKTDLI
ncbi:OX-2 membrane glycoprotein-like isoform X2 [Brachyhypopomus gauderio]|uniref:OX-2 membrane glycoprotein-like isoform X2 n=1 Tax=Brachyhypopomus gauderio TaxID=698409 RepID=UPI004041E5C5